MKKKFSELLTGQYFKTIHDPHIWSDGWIWCKNEFLPNDSNAFIFNGPPNYNGINSYFSDILVDHIHIGEVSIPNAMLTKTVENGKYNLEHSYQ